MKKFTETNKYKEEWFADLPPRLKLLYYYLHDSSDHAGIWTRNVRRLNFEIGEDKKPYNEDDLKSLEPMLVKATADKYILIDHLREQYPNGLGNSLPHIFVKNLIEKQGFRYVPNSLSIAYAYPSHRLGDTSKDKDMDTDKDMVKDTDTDKADSEKKPRAEAKGEFHEMLRMYESFILERTSAPAKIDGGETKALSEILRYLSGIESVNNSLKTAPEVWKYILSQFDKVEPFLRKGIKLKQINSSLIQIIDQIKNGQPSNNTKGKDSSDIRKAADLIRKGMEATPGA